jgi:hypothetical protein
MKAIRLLSATALALLVLVSSTSFMVGVHVCGGKVANVALFSHADGCENESVPPCHRQMKSSCCQDETIVHQGDDFKASLAQFDHSTPEFILVSPHVVILAELISKTSAFSSYAIYDPPLPSCDRIVAHHSFLI